jgi:exonuclease SbcC
MLTAISVRNFQSLKQVDLDLGVFTVIVGPSSSGKSALMRAFRALASNVRGSGVITRGQHQMAITYQTERLSVTLERDAKAGLYRISDAHGSGATYTKLNGEVPPDVTHALRLEPVPVNGTSVNFASQFDKPYLLDESGAVVARVLGELTNVNVVFEAVRRANRVRLDASGTLKNRKADLGALRGRLSEFAGLANRITTLGTLETLEAQAEVLRSRTGRLDTALRTLRITQRSLAAAVVPEVPSPDGLNERLNRYLDLQSKLRRVTATNERLKQADQQLRNSLVDVADLSRELTTKLQEAQVCPTCGQATV